MACWTACSEAIIGTIRFLEVRCASSTAIKLSGSAMARNSSSFEQRTGTMLMRFARFFGTYRDISGAMSTLVRSIYSMPSCMRRASISCRSVIKLCSIRIEPRRPFSLDWNSRACFNCSCVISPISRSISPNRFVRIVSPSCKSDIVFQIRQAQKADPCTAGNLPFYSW